MKNIFLFIAFFLFSFLSNAQKIQVKEDKDIIAGNKNPVLVVTIYGAKVSDVEKAWKSLMKSYKASVTNKNEIYANNATITDISAKTIDVYAVADKLDDGVKFTVAIDLGGAFMNSSAHPDQFKAAVKIVTNFAVEQSKIAISAKLDAEKSKQKDLEDNLRDLQKKNDKLHKEIEDYKARIADDEKDLDTNHKDQETATGKIESQKKVVDEFQKKLDSVK